MNPLSSFLATASPSKLQESVSQRIVGRLEDLPGLDKGGQLVMDALQPLVDKAEQSGLMDLLHGRWLGHALHPVLSDLPLGFWTAAALFDVLEMDAPAAVMSASGSLAAVGTAVTGIADWTVTEGRDRRLALLHGLMNASGLVLQLSSLALRLGRRRGAGRGLGMLGWIIGLGAAYFGGELVFGRGLMVDHNAWSTGPSEWTATIPAADLPEGQTKEVQADGHEVVLYREGGQVYAMENRCSHAGGPLSKGEVHEGVVTCPWHGSQFRLTDGSLRRGPATFPQLRLEARVNSGRVEVRGRRG
jgi:nitrite reductase/ring-hydroxylating ferredoxin subunit/uncharacterized membrane protein